MLSYTFSSPTPTFSLFPAELNHQYCRYASLGKRKRKGRKTKHLEKYTLRIPANCRSAYACAQDVPDNCVRTGTVCVRVSQLERTERPRENLDSLSVICRPSVIFFFLIRKKSRYFAKSFFPVTRARNDNGIDVDSTSISLSFLAARNHVTFHLPNIPIGKFGRCERTISQSRENFKDRHVLYVFSFRCTCATIKCILYMTLCDDRQRRELSFSTVKNNLCLCVCAYGSTFVAIMFLCLGISRVRGRRIKLHGNCMTYRNMT